MYKNIILIKNFLYHYIIMNQTIILIVVIIFSILISISGGVGYYFTTQQKSSTSSPSPTTTSPTPTTPSSSTTPTPSSSTTPTPSSSTTPTPSSSTTQTTPSSSTTQTTSTPEISNWCKEDGTMCVVPSNNKGLKIGKWTIEQDSSGNLVFRRDNAPNEADKPYFYISGVDGNVWVNRATYRGWIADNIAAVKNEVLKNNQNIALRSIEKNKCFDVMGDPLRTGSGWYTTNCNTTNDYQKWSISKRN
jgi:hypothetical protein